MTFSSTICLSHSLYMNTWMNIDGGFLFIQSTSIAFHYVPFGSSYVLYISAIYISNQV